MLVGIVSLLLFYIFLGLSMYAYAVLKYYELTGDWNFNIDNGYICNVFKYPKWILYWLEWFFKKIKGSK